MKLTKERTEATRTTRVIFEFDDFELARLKLDRMDRSLLAYNEDQPADVLLKAELICRRFHEQQHPHCVR